LNLDEIVKCNVCFCSLAGYGYGRGYVCGCGFVCGYVWLDLIGLFWLALRGPASTV
jgi:hypothetical protein